ncbi:30S ribosomal protein S10 [Candidatus Hydrogenosomobacter endosymbioticus]|uniref:Small ribosomal subunit protein uS10 n=1 Tax=Candidatus Hydrogenosomobacter endosymbioticus TaxID=2558174 RepID=A0ABN6L490_9PROT|nr:30S ribosomal protein S10 [Candidatus Hydrogenosomobacter endosymbioticus]BDB96579.1 30S ribosomal protein S10 [Candidatus Hydrogenosomobacter endosymbioticus]
MSVGSQNIRMRLRGYDHKVLDKSVREIMDTAERTGAGVRGPIPLPKKIKKVTVLRSPHEHKKARDQFEIRTYSRLIDITDCNHQTLDALMGLDLSSEIEVEIKV